MESVSCPNHQTWSEVDLTEAYQLSLHQDLQEAKSTKPHLLMVARVEARSLGMPMAAASASERTVALAQAVDTAVELSLGIAA